jgi:hypothetical protein
MGCPSIAVVMETVREGGVITMAAEDVHSLMEECLPCIDGV